MKIGDRTLASYTYETGTNRMTRQTYGNGQYVSFQYDAHGRLTQKSYADGSTTKYYYDNCNQIAKTVDSRSGITTVYYYDLIGRLVGYHETSTTLDHRVTYSYDEQDRPKAMKETIDGHTKNYTYTYNKEDKLASMTVDGITLNYTYDAFGRLATQTKVYNTTNTTVKTNNISYTGTSTTTSNQISTFNSWEYTYNNKGYIASVTPDVNTTHYTYNSAGYLIREDNQKLGKSFRWYYNSAGNIIAKKTYAHTTGELGTPLETVTYTYGSEDAGKWNDLLTGYNGQTLTYNDMGSLKSDGTWNYYWKRGRELGSMVSDDTTWTYSYNGDGIRIGRTDGTNTYTYIYNGDKLTRVQYNGKLVRYNYDESGRPISLRYNNVLYFVDTNLQGDVVGIRETEDNERVVNYVYDAYGKICSITGSLKDSLGVHNVLRYRGYVYDQETGLYYLQSRYYNPEWGRFISADVVLAGPAGGLQGRNLFAYANNNPVNMSDPDGNWPQWIKDTVKWVAKNIVKPVVKTVQKTLSKVDLTYSTGVNVSGTPKAWIFNGQIGVSVDTKGNVAIQASGGGGITGGDPSISITRYQSVTNAPNIDKLNDAYYQVGGSIAALIEGVPVAAGGDVMFMPDPALNTGYFGLTGNVGFGSPGKEFHVEWGTTVTLPYTQFNVYEVARSVYIKIMEW